MRRFVLIRSIYFSRREGKVYGIVAGGCEGFFSMGRDFWRFEEIVKGV